MVLLVLVFGPIGILAALTSGSARPIFALAAPLVRSSLRVAGVRIRVRGREHVDPETAYLFAANHLSNADPPVLYTAIGRDVRVLAKAELFRIPVFGTLLRTAGMIPVHRRDRERSIEAVERGARALAAGTDFLVFVEGTRSPDGLLQPLKKGPFVMAIRAQAPVLPVVVRGTRAIQPKGSRLIRAGSVDVEFLPPVSTAGMDFDDRAILRDRVESRMRAALEPVATGSPAPARSPEELQ